FPFFLLLLLLLFFRNLFTQLCHLCILPHHSLPVPNIALGLTYQFLRNFLVLQYLALESGIVLQFLHQPHSFLRRLQTSFRFCYLFSAKLHLCCGLSTTLLCLSHLINHSRQLNPFTGTGIVAFLIVVFHPLLFSSPFLLSHFFFFLL
ncbi:hypothetical protein PFISCL1PPCAC_28605, partial [Pristionchus fissidentatus]